MTNATWFPTAAVADACVRVGVPLRVPRCGVAPVSPGMRLVGPARPVVHEGSVDAFLEAIESGRPGDVLVVDNEGREDEACIGDLTVIEARAADFAGAVVWGRHRDTAQLRRLGWPVFSCGVLPSGPTRVPTASRRDASRVTFDGVEVEASDVVFGDDDGIVIVSASDLDRVAAAASAICAAEREQAARVEAGVTLRDQFAFARYLRDRAADPTLTFRAHLRRIDAAIEE